MWSDLVNVIIWLMCSDMGFKKYAIKQTLHYKQLGATHFVKSHLAENHKVD